MKWTYLILLLAFAGSDTINAQTQTPPQTARQALLEMLLEKTPAAFEKHLPDAARATLLRGDDTAPMPILRELTSFRTGVAASGGQLDTFDSGPVLLAVEDKNTQHKIEIIVERDDLEGDGEEIELSLHPYHEGNPDPLPVVPRIILSMKQEKEVWKLNEVTVALHVPLSDQDYLKGLQKIQNSGLESSAVGSLRTLNTAEISYSAIYPERGFTCKLSKLGGSGTTDQTSSEHALLIDDALASGQHSGYVFSISGCDIPPASKYRATAAPVDPDSGMRAFCSDESAVIRYSADGKAANCLSEGVPLE
jgi:type IV pilus assembly protein PilA